MKTVLYILGGLAILGLLYWAVTRNSGTGTHYTAAAPAGGGGLLGSITSTINQIKGLFSSVGGSTGQASGQAAGAAGASASLNAGSTGYA